MNSKFPLVTACQSASFLARGPTSLRASKTTRLWKPRSMAICRGVFLHSAGTWREFPAAIHASTSYSRPCSAKSRSCFASAGLRVGDGSSGRHTKLAARVTSKMCLAQRYAEKASALSQLIRTGMRIMLHGGLRMKGALFPDAIGLARGTPVPNENAVLPRTIHSFCEHLPRVADICCGPPASRWAAAHVSVLRDQIRLVGRRD